MWHLILCAINRILGKKEVWDESRLKNQIIILKTTLPSSVNLDTVKTWIYELLFCKDLIAQVKINQLIELSYNQDRYSPLTF